MQLNKSGNGCVTAFCGGGILSFRPSRCIEEISKPLDPKHFEFKRILKVLFVTGGHMGQFMFTIYYSENIYLIKLEYSHN
ncbi:hypothetical protein GDO86_001848 [Hymenochirus boettgeri]|uniref:Uncharacterized protein n=1 Tax=Hymenochirus boettgeri TaxID=247094 RepID=A0A8T2KEF1_9PIPI|nr:hypothetical protein GDO86_001848 [Hymenochirus boettgeri]